MNGISEWLRLSDSARAALLAGPERDTWIERLARYGFAEAQTLWGQLLLDARPHATRGVAFGWFTAAAAAGYAPAINMQGRCLEHGWDVDVDRPAAAACYRRAAQAGYDWGQYNLGCVLMYGIGVPRDRVAAFPWLERAAAAGLPKAANLLGRFHEEGWDRPASRIKAARCYRIAATGGDYRGMFNLAALLHRQGRVAEATDWLRSAIDRGNPHFLAELRDRLQGNDDPVIQHLADEAEQRRAFLNGSPH